MTRLTRLLLLVPAAAALLPASDPMITTMSMPDGVVGQVYDFQFEATGGTTPYTWQVTGLPMPLQADSSGHILGLPDQAGMYMVQAMVQDALMIPDSRVYSLVINPAPLTVTTTSLPNGKPGIPYSGQVNASGGVPPYYFGFGEGGEVPPGLMMDFDGQIVGTPTMLGTYNTVVEVYDSSNDSWATAAALPFPSYWIQAVSGDDGRIYTFTVGPTAAVGIYDPTLDSWSLGASNEVGRSGAGAALMADGSIVVVGGPPREYRRIAEAYNPSEDSWRPLASLADEREYAEAVADLQGSVYVLGGGTLRVERYVAEEGVWY